jgi:hypothetical protein
VEQYAQNAGEHVAELCYAVFFDVANKLVVRTRRFAEDKQTRHAKVRQVFLVEQVAAVYETAAATVPATLARPGHFLKLLGLGRQHFLSGVNKHHREDQCAGAYQCRARCRERKQPADDGGGKQKGCHLFPLD